MKTLVQKLFFRKNLGEERLNYGAMDEEAGEGIETLI